MNWLSKLIDNASNYFAHRKGLLPLIGVLLVIVNFFLPFLVDDWITRSNLLLYSL